MAIIIDIKNAIRRAIYTRDNDINFFFNEILKVQYPYVYCYFPEIKLDGYASAEYYRNIRGKCVLNCAVNENSTTTELIEYFESLISDAVYSLNLVGIVVLPSSYSFNTNNNVFQATFDFQYTFKYEDETELMKELNLSIK